MEWVNFFIAPSKVALRCGITAAGNILTKFVSQLKLLLDTFLLVLVYEHYEASNEPFLHVRCNLYKLPCALWMRLWAASS